MIQTTIELPAELFELTVGQRPASDAVSLTCATYKADFDKAKHLLSGKPLRRPNRQRPLDRSASIKSASDELSRRQLLQRRMPPRSRIQTILDQRPAHDPWLDDEHDWRP